MLLTSCHHALHTLLLVSLLLLPISALIPFGSFPRPMGVAVDSSGFVYVADQQLQAAYKLSPNGTVLRNYTDSFYLPSPACVCVDSALSYVYVSSNQFVAQFRNNVSSALRLFPNQWIVQSMTVDSQGSLYVVLYNFLSNPAGYINRFLPNGTLAQVFTSSSLVFPRGVVVDAALNVYIGVPNANSIYVFSPSGAVIGSYSSSYGYYWLALDDRGDLLTSDSVNPVTLRNLSTTPVAVMRSASASAAAVLNTWPLGVSAFAQGLAYDNSTGPTHGTLYLNVGNSYVAVLTPPYANVQPPVQSSTAVPAVTLGSSSPAASTMSSAGSRSSSVVSSALSSSLTSARVGSSSSLSSSALSSSTLSSSAASSSTPSSSAVSFSLPSSSALPSSPSSPATSPANPTPASASSSLAASSVAAAVSSSAARSPSSSSSSTAAVLPPPSSSSLAAPSSSPTARPASTASPLLTSSVAADAGTSPAAATAGSASSSASSYTAVFPTGVQLSAAPVGREGPAWLLLLVAVSAAAALAGVA